MYYTIYSISEMYIYIYCQEHAYLKYLTYLSNAHIHILSVSRIFKISKMSKIFWKCTYTNTVNHILYFVAQKM